MPNSVYNRMAKVLGKKGSFRGGVSQAPGGNAANAGASPPGGNPGYGAPSLQQRPLAPVNDPNSPEYIPGAYIPPQQKAPTYGAAGAGSYYGGQGGFGKQRTASDSPPGGPIIKPVGDKFENFGPDDLYNWLDDGRGGRTRLGLKKSGTWPPTKTSGGSYGNPGSG